MYAYNLNLSFQYDVSGPQYAQFREAYGQLYRNPILQQYYLNRIGQGLVPRDTPENQAANLKAESMDKLDTPRRQIRPL